MEVLRPGDAAAFLRLAGPLLERDEARNQLSLAIASTLVLHPEAYEVVRYWVAVDAGRPAAAALRTGPHDLVLGDPVADDAFEALVAGVIDDDPGVPGVVGNVPWVERAAASLASATGRRQEPILWQGVHALASVADDVPQALGSSRVARAADRDLIVAWLRAFLTEAVPEPDTHLAALEDTVRIRLDSGSDAGYWFWDDGGRPVSVSGFGGRSPTGIRIGPVYTPPEHRRRGYATSLVAEQSRWLLGRGHRACFLFTDLTNPTSNAIYARIGYRQVCESRVFRFRRA